MEALVGRSGTPFSIASGITPPAPEIGWPPPSNMSERLTANRAPFGQKAPALRSDTLIVGVASLAAPVRPLAAAAVVRATAWRASRRLRCEGFGAELFIRGSTCLTRSQLFLIRL